MELVHIINVDEVKQTMRVLVYVVEEWEDPTLSWDPTNFSGLRVTWLPEDSIWVPDIIVFNMLDHQELLHSVRSPIRISHTGRITFSYPAIYSVMCRINVAKFPFDTQKCDLRIASWGYGEEKIFLNASRKPFLQHYTANEEWALQERFTLGVTAILSMAVLSLVVTEKVPHSSEEVPLLIVYFHFNIVMVTLATTLTSTVMRVHSKGFSHRMLPPPQWLLRYLFIQGADFTSIPNGNSVNVKKLVIAEQWGAVSRRMDILLALFFLVTVSTPTIYLFILCYSMDNNSQERELLERSREPMPNF
ncbi:Neurotransmitter-gated ion-channel ligand binding domain protein [Ancylostoma ceylanicum]|uniref:Neurotransmitter-gated ion-channel ligand binding domain protein n=1 Tax=Ancylostoma ceylanicum TaxID=53326 RepID=A0A0D6M5D0_9BILA|nr:Neurotransmitter-gated ion-channel ligand binding domain protein [Ancylostoma ceylanicum]